MNPAGSALLDTNIVIAHFRNDRIASAHLESATSIYLPWVALGELYYGALRAQRRETQLALIRDFLQIATLLLPDQGTTERYGHVKAGLSAAGQPIPDNDIWIAALALQYDLPVATRDVRFRAIPQLKILEW